MDTFKQMTRDGNGQFEKQQFDMGRIHKMFWMRVNITNNCWLWTGALNKKRGGYGYFKSKGKIWRVHRLSYEIHNGIFDTNYDVCHKCDNPPCVNPNHLFLGTAKENCQDTVRKGRTKRGKDHGLNLHPERRPWGERNGQSKLTIEAVQDIRKSYESRVSSVNELASKYKVSEFNIYKVLSRKLWPNV